MTGKRAKVRLSYELLAKMLHLRDGISITGVANKPNIAAVDVFLEAEHFRKPERLEESVILRLVELTDMDTL